MNITMKRLQKSLLRETPYQTCLWSRSRSSLCVQSIKFGGSEFFSRCNITSSNKREHRGQKPAIGSILQKRSIGSWLPEALNSFSIWGGSGFMLKTIHTTTGMPYWACFATISVAVRSALFPLVLYSAQTAGRFAKIAPDVQFQLALFQQDMKKYRAAKASLSQIMFLMRTNMTTLASTYKLHNIHPFSVFLSPLIQIPIFWYISVDLRKIVNGLDPMLAQTLVETSVAWIPDLTEPDPWFGLPIVAGALLYSNMEVALGKRNMAGEAASKADTSLLLKDAFQSLAIFMPCFTSQLPGGVQVYIVTSFCFTLVQSVALRTEPFRRLVGLPSMLIKPVEGKYTSQMVELKKLEQQAKKLRGDGPLLGKGILMYGWETSFAGTHRKSSIAGSTPIDRTATEAPTPFRIQPFSRQSILEEMYDVPALSAVVAAQGPYIHGISAPPWQLEAQRKKMIEIEESNHGAPALEREYLPQFSDETMNKANRGEYPRTQFVKEGPRLPSTAAKVKVKSARRKKGKSKRS